VTTLRAGWLGFDSFSVPHRVQTGSGAYPMGTRGYFPGAKAAGAWSWQLTFKSAECVELYLHSPICLHRLV